VTGKKGETRSLEERMPDSRAIDAERRLQPMFRKFERLQLLILAGLILAFGLWLVLFPRRVELGPRIASLQLRPIQIDAEGFAPLRIAGAWEVTSDDPRFGGVSALAIDDERLVALSDSGVLIRFAKPGRGDARAWINELPGGPGDPAYKISRDSEALAETADRQGWWVGFEYRNELWRFDRRFTRATQRVRFGARRWSRNSGIEAAVVEGRSVLLLPEPGTTVVRVSSKGQQNLPIQNPAGRISDVARLPGGGLLVLNRRVTRRGFVNSLAALERSGAGYRYGKRVRLGLGPLDNAEALAAERTSAGTRLWIMTDNNFSGLLRTVLIAADLPSAEGRNQAAAD
jgi:hypothetical protein